jgi:hypothetical protein
MGKAIQVRLEPVRQRQQQLRALSCAAVGLFASALALVVVILGRWLGGWQLPAAVALVVAALGPVIGYVVGVLWRRDWRDAAAAVDAHYGLKDRVITALDFLHKPQATKVHKLAVADAMDHLERVDARQVVPSDTPQVLPAAIVSLAAAALLFVFTSLPARVNASPSEPIAVIVESAEYASEELKSLEEFAREEQDAEIEKLVMEMKQTLDEMKQPGVDLREALAKLSQMQSALEQQQAKFNAGQVDAELQAVGDALALSESMAEAGKALAAGQLERAAEELEKLDTPKLDRKTEKAIKEKLDALAKQMQDSGSSSLCAAVGEASKGLGGDGSRFKQGMKRLAGEALKQSKRKKLNDLLRKQCDCLGECKGECECNSNGGYSKGKGGSNWGRGATGNELGEKTPEMGGKYESRLTGRQSDEGEVEVETTHSPEGKQEAQRDYRATYDKYRKISEAVLDSEPIPLGHRQTIRRYFEAIRPSEAETDAVQGATKSP